MDFLVWQCRCVVMIAGVNIAKDTLTPLIGEPIDPSIYHEITEFVEKYDGIIGTHDLIVHNYGLKPQYGFHSCGGTEMMSRLKTVMKLSTRSGGTVRSSWGIFLVIHMDPVEIRMKNHPFENDGSRDLSWSGLQADVS